MVRETGRFVVRKCGRCNDCCSVLFFSGGRAMRRKTIWGRVCTAVLILSLLAGAVAVVFTGGRVRRPIPLPEQAQVLQPDRQERGGSGGTSDDVPLTQSPEPTEPSEEPDETETAEPSTEPDEPTDATSATQTTQMPEPSEEPTRSTGGGTEPTEEPGPAPTEAPGPEEPHIVTDLVSRVWRSGELDGDTLRFYAYAAGSGDLSLRVYYKESGSTANNGTRLLPADDRNFSVRLTLNQSYTFSLYLYRDGRRVGDAAVYHISYRARLGRRRSARDRRCAARHHDEPRRPDRSRLRADDDVRRLGEDGHGRFTDLHEPSAGFDGRRAADEPDRQRRVRL